MWLHDYELEVVLDNAADVGHTSLVFACWGVFVMLFSSLWKKLHKLYSSTNIIGAIRQCC